MKKLSIPTITVILCVLFPLCPQGALGWHNDPRINTPVWLSDMNQIDHTAIPDSAGGSIVVWAEKVGETKIEFDIYAHRIDSHGESVWSAPAAICTAPGYQGLPQIVTDGVGGAIIVWIDARDGWEEDFRNFDIYAQRINGDGHDYWPTDGVPICTAPNWQVYVVTASDGQGGLVLVWDDGRSGDSQVYCQKVNNNGQTVWQQNGVLAADVPFGQSSPDIASDGLGGALVVWCDLRELGNFDVYAQRIDQAGNKVWGAEGLALARVPGEQFSAHVISSGSGGGIFSWADSRQIDGEFDIYVQKVDATGAIQWPAQGLPVIEVEGSQLINAIVSDGSGGVIIAWEDARKGNGDPDIYAQRVTSEGVLALDPTGTPIVTTEHVQKRPALISDGAGGAFITWQDFYRGGHWWNIYAQHLDGSGQIRWEQDGVAISIADKTQSDPLIIPDDSGGSIIIWYDNRSGQSYDIYAQQVDRRGLLGGGEFKFYTADIDGKPKKTFAPGELILFRATWTVPAPSTPNGYESTSGMAIHSRTAYRQELVTYEVIGD